MTHPVPARPADLYLHPVGLLSGDAARLAVGRGGAIWLAGGPMAFPLVELAVRHGERVARSLMPVAEVEPWAAGLGDAFLARARSLLAALTDPRPRWAGLSLDRPLVMGIVNVTPDSFSDGGDHAQAAAAIAHGLSLLKAGADILDVGGESTRPGAEPVPLAEELARTIPVVRALAAEGAVVSIDTRHAAVMRAALEAGARIVNDVTALAGDPDSLGVVADAACPVALMHMQGQPQTMQKDPRYLDVALDVFDWLEERVVAAEVAGISRDRIAVDYGIGFGKTLDHNLQLLSRTALFHGLGCPLLVGVSRKRFIGTLSREEPPKQRVPGSLAAGLAAVGQGAQVLRVHDVAETAQARAVWVAL